ncbi:MAG: substrate-binding domain-containing protein, partial [Calothrix sp. C42_A2020_038]|nr:substrate-binding domain-containing protein [Calothrix sp. C42_A2020_038]
MWQKQKKYSPIVCLALLLALASTPIAATLLVSQLAVAQTEANKEKDPSFPLPTNIENGTTIKIDGSSNLARINESLKQSFEQKYPGAKVELATSGTDTALKSLIDGKIDLAAISRGLTSAELAQGLEQKRLRREKIAIVVSENNPFKGNITNQQFAKIFRGEITNWSQIGGKPGKIRFIDRPNTSDTREAFRNYPAFKTAKFTTGANATQLSTDDTVELVRQLGDDGISYIIANQVSKVPGLRVLSLHKTLPDDPRYPFSQPLVYAFKKNPSPGVVGFLGFATAQPGTQAVEAARSQEAASVAQSVSSSGNTTTSAANPRVSALGTNATPGTDTTTQANTNTIASGTDTTTQANTNTIASGTDTTTQANTDTTATSTAPPNNTDTTGAVTFNNDTATTDTVNSGNITQANASSQRQTGTFPWWILLPLAALGGGILWWLLGKGNKRQEALTGASTLPIVGTPDTSTDLSKVATSTPANLVDSSTNAATNLTSDVSDLPSNLPAGAALTGAATGIGLWSRLTGGDIEEPSEDAPQETASITNESELSVDAPAAVVMPTHLQANLSQIDKDTTSVTEPAVDINTTNIDVEPELTTPSDLTEIETTPSIEPTEASLDSSNLNQQQLLDVWEDTEEPNQSSPNWLDSISSAGGNAVAGGAALAAGAAAAGAGLWSRFANRDHDADHEPDTDLTVSPEISDINQTASQEPTSVVEAENDTETPEVIETIYIEPATTSLDTSFDTETSLPDVWQDVEETETQAGSNWLDNIREASQSTLTGGAALAAGAAAAGAGLWSRFANRDHQDNDDNHEPETNLDVTSEIPETTDVSLSPSQEIALQETENSNSVSITTSTEPTDVVDAELNPVETISTEPTATPSISSDTSEVNPTVSVDAATELPDVLQDAEETETQAGSNWLDNIREASQSTLTGGAALAAGAAAAGAGLWSRFANRDHQDNDDNHEPETNLDVTSEIPETTDVSLSPSQEIALQETENSNSVSITTSTEPTDVVDAELNPVETISTEPTATPSISSDTSEVNPTVSVDAATELPDVLQDAEETETQAGSNWLDNIREASQSTLTGGAALAAGAAAAGAGLWSRFANRDHQDNDDNHEPETNLDVTSEIPETTDVSLSPSQEIALQETENSNSVSITTSTEPTDVVDAELNPVETISTEPTATPSISSDTSEVNPTVSVDAATELPDVLQDAEETETQAGSNWLDNIREASQSTLTGGAALAAGAAAAGAGLWSRFANSGNSDERVSETNTTNEENEIVIDTNEVFEPTITVDVDEVAQPTFVEPTITVDVNEVAQPTLVEPTITVDVDEVAQPTFVEPTITVDV